MSKGKYIKIEVGTWIDKEGSDECEFSMKKEVYIGSPTKEQLKKVEEVLEKRDE